MNIQGFRKRLVEYEVRARARQAERLDARDDTPWQFAVVEELLIDLLERVERLEGILEVEPSKASSPELPIDTL